MSYKSTFSQVLIAFLTLFLAACNNSNNSPESNATITLPDIDTSSSSIGVVALPEQVHQSFRDNFNKYTKLVAPNGKPIHFLGQSGVSEERLARAREIMRFYLTDFPGSEYGSNKTAVANALGDNKATLIYTDTEDNSFRLQEDFLQNTDLGLQDLYATESPIEGSREYINNTERDAAYEEIFHLLHGHGIQTALPKYNQEMIEAAAAAQKSGTWKTTALWLQEGSGHFEYIISAIDNYYDLWKHDPDGNGTSFGDEYTIISREQLTTGDPLGYSLVTKFLPPFLGYTARIDRSFDGTFSLTLDENTPYTLKSQYLVNAALTGEKHSNLMGNEQDNKLRGNSGNNELNGGEGSDTALFSGTQSEYAIELTDNKIQVTDTLSGRDGNDTLVNIEYLEFSDGILPIKDIQ